MSGPRPLGEPHRTDFANPAEVAVEVTEVKGQMALLAQQVSTGLSNVISQLSAVQGELRELQKGQHDIQAHSTGLERLATVLERHIDANQAWQRAHAIENQQVADRVTFWRGMVIGVVALGGLLTTAGIYFVQDGRAQDAAERVRLEAQHAADVSRIERVIERNQADIRELQQGRTVR